VIILTGMLSLGTKGHQEFVMTPNILEIEENLSTIRGSLTRLSNLMLALSGCLGAQLVLYKIRGDYFYGEILPNITAFSLAFCFHYWFLSYQGLRRWVREIDRRIGAGAAWAMLSVDPGFEKASVFCLGLPPLVLCVSAFFSWQSTPLIALISGLAALLVSLESLSLVLASN
jgi:hypothetical protein